MDQATSRLAEEQARYVREARAICDAARQRGIHLRVLGAISFIIHCPRHMPLLEALERELTDIDLLGLEKQEREIRGFFAEMGLEAKGGGVTMEVWVGRRIFKNSSTLSPDVDVFFDRLDFCHPIDLRKRIDLDYPTISLADMVLEKMQIVEINEKDLKDVIVLSLEHELGEADAPETINARYIASLLADDWGFYYTVTTNLNKVKLFADRYDPLGEVQRRRVHEQMDHLLTRIEEAPKSFKWKLRSRVGTKTRWYKEVGEGYRM